MKLTKKLSLKKALLFSCVLIVSFVISVSGQSLDQWQFTSPLNLKENTVTVKDQFNGYTTHWTNEYWKWIQYGNLFQMNIPDVDNYIMQKKLNITEELGILGFWMEEGFLSGLLYEKFIVLENPSFQMISEYYGNENLLIYINSELPLGIELEAKLPSDDKWKNILKSYQYQSGEYKSVKAFYLENGTKKMFVVSSEYPERLNIVKKLIGNVEKCINNYDMHRGWAGVGTSFYSVTCSYGHPLDIIGRAMNQGNDWILFSEPKLKNDLENWLGKINLSLVADVGSWGGYNSYGTVMYGCCDYDGLRKQNNRQKIEDVIKFAREQNGYIFRPVYQDKLDKYQFDGYIGNLGNKEQIDNENVPFIISSGGIRNRVPDCMVLFIEKNLKLTKKLMYDAILDRRAVAVMGYGQMMGPEYYRNVLQFLLLDRVFLEEYFSSRIHLDTKINNRKLTVTITNTYPKNVSGILEIVTPPELELKKEKSSNIILPAASKKTMEYIIKPSLNAMNKDNPVAVNFLWKNKKKETLTVMSLPPVISIHKLMYGYSPELSFPVTVHNYTGKSSFPVKVQVFEKNKPGNIIYEDLKNINAEPGEFQTSSFLLNLPAGNFYAKVTALGSESISQIGVGSKTGSPGLYEIDLNGDGINEYRMENDKVKVTLLRTGARVIEYIVKERNDNILFKLWPQKEDTDREPYRKRRFYPYGGFEDFLGQPSMETHHIYDAEIIQEKGDYVRVK